MPLVPREGADDGGDASGRLPNLVIAGVPKAGTTSLFRYLTQHPDITGSDVKELRYFSDLRYGAELGPIKEYTRHFAHCRGVRYAMEATPEYFYGGGTISSALERTCPGVHVLVSLRSPADRCWSWFRFVRTRLQVSKDMSFDAYLDRCEVLTRAGLDRREENFAFSGLWGGCYAEWFDSWREILGPRFRVVSFEDLAREPSAVVREVCEWLGLGAALADDFVYRVENRTRQYRLERLQRLAMAVNRRSDGALRGERGAKLWLRNAYHRLNRKTADDILPDSGRARLEAFYRPHNARLAEQMASAGVPLPVWLRDASALP